MLHLMRISNNEFWRENIDTRLVGKEQTKNRTQHEGNCVKYHESRLKERYLYERIPSVSVVCTVSDGHRIQPPRTLTAGNCLEEDRQGGGSSDELDVYRKGPIGRRIGLNRHIWKQ